MTPFLRTKIFFCLLFGMLLQLEVAAQLDTKHYIPPFFAKVEDQSGTSNIRRHFVSLSTPSEDTIPVTIRNGYGEVINVIEISRNSPQEYQLGPLGNATGNVATSVYPLNVVPRDSLNMPIRSQGLYFESFQPFFVNMRHKSGSQGTSLTSKGQIALGNRFYSGHLYTIYNTGSGSASWNNFRRSHFISVMATEDNTEVTFDLIKDPISYIGQTPGEPITVTLDAFESYVIGVDHADYDNATINNSNGTRITSTKPIACNTGSWLSGNSSGQCIGSDQIVPADIVGQEYILVRGLGDSSTERPMVVATEDGTEVFINDNATPSAVLDEGEFFIVPTTEFTANDNLYILATEKVYMYQTLSGSSSSIGPTVGLNFIPPLNCIGAKEVNLPFVNSLAGGNGQGRINIITKAGTSIFVNESTTPLTGAQAVTGNADWVTYAFDPPSNNVIIESDSVMNVALLTRDDQVGTAGYFSGFTLEPVVGLSSGTSNVDPCIPGNAVLQVFGFDTYQWYFNGDAIVGATGNTLFPEFAGNYSVDGIDLTCGFMFRSRNFDIPFCPSTLGAAKALQDLSETAPGSRIFDLTYQVFIENLAESPSQNIQIIENINGGLPTGATAELIGTPELSFGILTGGLNPAFDGETDRRLLPGTGSIPGNAADAITLTIRVDMNNATQDGYFNQVTATSKNSGTNNGLDGPFNGQDFSDDGTNPDPNGNGEPNEDGENDPTLTCFFTNEISYAQTSFCTSDGLQEVAVEGVSAGEFTADLPGLDIDINSGVISTSESSAGTYQVTFTTLGRCPTVTTTEVDIVAPPTPGTAVVNTEICIDAESILLTDYLDGEEPGGVWTDSNGEEISETYIPTIPGDFTLTYTVITDPCPAESEPVTINVIGEPDPGTVVENPAACVDAGTVNLFDFIVGEQPVGQWFDEAGDPVSNVQAINGVETLNFTYEISNMACGSRISELALTVNPLSDAGVSLGDADVCAGEMLDLFDFLMLPDLTGDWSDADGTIIPDQTTIPDPGQVTYTYITENVPCDADSTSVTFTVSQGPSSGAVTSPVAICKGDPSFNLISLLAGATTGGTFTNGSGATVSGIFNPETAGNYDFTYTVNSVECGDISTTFTLNVANNNCINRVLTFPEGFSPNADGIGDTWVISAIDQYPANSLIIFNRWGAEVFTARPYTNNWDGTAASGLNAGDALPVGTYWYVVDLGDGSEIKKGFIYLNR